MAKFDQAIPVPVHKLARMGAARKPAAKRAKQGTKLPPKRGDGLVRQTFTMERDEAREAARDFMERWPKAAYWSRVEHWAQLPDGRIEFTMVRLPTAD